MLELETLAYFEHYPSTKDSDSWTGSARRGNGAKRLHGAREVIPFIELKKPEDLKERRSPDRDTRLLWKNAKKNTREIRSSKTRNRAPAFFTPTKDT